MKSQPKFLLSTLVSLSFAVTPGYVLAQSATKMPSSTPTKSFIGDKRKKQNGDDLNAIEPAAGPTLGMGASLLLAGAAIGGVAAAFGGGGGGDSSDSGFDLPDGNPEPSLPEVPASGNEVANSTSLPVINAQAAYGRGYTGNGIRIGIVDTGFNTNHDEFIGKIDGCYNAATDEEGCNNTVVRYHGGHVAGLAAANQDAVGMHGVAYNATLYSADIFNGNDVTVSLNRQADAIDKIVSENVQIANNSYGFTGSYKDFSAGVVDVFFGPSTDIYNAYDNAVNNDVIMVWAAGNSSEANPSLYGALPEFYPEFEDLWVSVAAVSTADGALADYSNSCGDVDYCISAPGGDFSGGNADGGILSAGTNDDTYLRAAGTSMAAPNVSGGLALIMEAFGPGSVSNLTAEEVVDIMFETANDTGIYADASIYGRGLLDLDAATSPTAPLALATGTSFSVGAFSLRDTRVSFGPAFGTGPAQAMKGLSAGAHDRYGRIFQTDLSNLVKPGVSTMDSGLMLSNFNTAEHQNITLTNDASLQLTYGQNNATRKDFHNSPLQNASKELPFKSLSYTSSVGTDSKFAFHYGTTPGHKLGLQTHERLESSPGLTPETSLNPYLDFAGTNSVATGLTKSLGDRFQIGALAFTNMSSDHNPVADQDNQFDDVSGTAIEAKYAVSNNLNVSILSGSIQEDDNILGTRAEGAFDIGNDTNSFFTGLNMDYSINNDLSLIASWQKGWTNPTALENSLFTDFSTIESDSFTLGLTGQDSFRDDDQWGLIVNQPVRVSSAKATVSSPVGRADNGAVLYDQNDMDLSPQGREINFQAFYKVDYTPQENISAGLVYRTQPNHDKNADSEAIGLLRYNLKY